MTSELVLLKPNADDKHQVELVMWLQKKGAILVGSLFPQHSMVNPRKHSEKTPWLFCSVRKKLCGERNRYTQNYTNVDAYRHTKMLTLKQQIKTSFNFTSFTIST